MKRKTVKKKYKFDNFGSTKASQQLAKKRQKRIQKFAEILPSPSSLESLEGKPEKLPFIHLWIGLRQYAFGFFENSILNSAFAAEYALVLRLNEKLNKDEKKVISAKGLGFSGAIKKAKFLSLIDETLYQDLVVLCNLRNMAAHPSNWMTFFNLLDQRKYVFDIEWMAKTAGMKPEEIEGLIKDPIEKENLEKAKNKLISYKEEKVGQLPDLEWAAHRSTLEEQREIVKKYSEKMIKDLLLDRQIFRLIEKPREAAKFIMKSYPYPEELALRAFAIVVETLRQLKFMS
jgi:hypothetical protein